MKDKTAIERKCGPSTRPLLPPWAQGNYHRLTVINYNILILFHIFIMLYFYQYNILIHFYAFDLCRYPKAIICGEECKRFENCRDKHGLSH